MKWKLQIQKNKQIRELGCASQPAPLNTISISSIKEIIMKCPEQLISFTLSMRVCLLRISDINKSTMKTLSQ